MTETRRVKMAGVWHEMEDAETLANPEDVYPEDSEGFPLSTDVKIQVQGSVLIGALKRVTPALCKDKFLPILTCVKITAGAPFERNGKRFRELCFEATDRFIIARMAVEIDCDQCESSPDSATAVIEYARIPKLDARTFYEITVGDGLTIHELYGTSASGSGAATAIPNAEGDYPNLDRIFVDALDGTHMLPATVQFDPARLLAVAKMAFGKGEAVRLSYTDAERPGSKPLAISIPGVDGFTGLIMPQRV